MRASKIIIFFLVLILALTVCYCCDILHYSAVCEEEQIAVTVSFERSFEGTIFANGYNGDPNCSTTNMETSGSTLVALSLPFLNCNTTIRRFVGEDNLQAMNEITIQFHPLIKSVLDCEIITTCDIDYPLPQEFFRSYLNRDLELPTPVDSKLDIMSAEKLFGDELSNILEVNGKQFLVLNVTDGGKYVQLRIRKCYAHAKYVIDQVTDPDLLLEDNQCARVGLLNWLSLKADKSYSDLRDFSEVQNFDLSFSQKTFYITCAFDRCLHSCPYSCFGETEINNNRWSTVRTHKVGHFDKSFKGFRNSNMDLRTSVRILSDRLLKLKELQIARKNTLNSKQRSPRLDAAVDAANVNPSTVIQKETFTVHDDSNKLIILDEEVSTIYIPDISEDESVVSVNQASFQSFIGGNLNSSEKKVSERIGRLSIVEDETEFSISEDTTIVESSQPTVIDLSYELKNHSGIDCVKSSCMPNEVTRSILALENSITNSMPSNYSSLEFDEAIGSTSDYNLSAASGGNSTADNSIEKDCVPYLKFSSVTASLSVLSVCLFFICFAVILYSRKERKRYASHSKYLYNDF
ncbi:uncharacterized protein [Parasteatoda tepidariorum]|uniref:uncharacterized protein n=1 Tax=Parasteatoda tepidariorum TaxID=114398 RepID=UPI001C72444D|nr:uncharacterized protein LOC107452727 [Parasteatoda tepidariorum]